MKKIIIILSIVFVFFSCDQDYLDKTPDDLLTTEDVFSDKDQTFQWLANAYGAIPDYHFQFFDNEVWPYMSGEGLLPKELSDDVFHASRFVFGKWTTNSQICDVYENTYEKIRQIHIFLNRVQVNTEAQLTVPQVEAWKAEARFLRAYYYAILLRRYGPVPLILEELPGNLLPQDFPRRNPYDEIVDFIASELTAVAAILPDKRSANDIGRPTRGSALAVLSRTLLYAASPQFNGNPDYASFTGSDGQALFNGSYDENKWKKAADISKQLIDLGHFELFTSAENDPALSYRDLFLTPVSENSELIFVRPKVDTRINPNFNLHERFLTPKALGGANLGGITQEMVDAFRMENGLEITDPNSGYAENGFAASDGRYHEQGTFLMYAHREPRFYAQVMYNDRPWSNPALIFNNQANYRCNFTFNGPDGRAINQDTPITGALVHKFVHPTSQPNQGIFAYRPGVLYRLGEIYLNYVEALNEYSPGHPDILLYLNKIRERGGIPALTGGYNQEEMRTLIRKERQIELAFECGHRFWDIRRWKIASEVYAKGSSGMNIFGTNPTIGNSDSDFYKRTYLYDFLYHERTNLLPIPQYIMDRNPNLVQNPGW